MFYGGFQAQLPCRVHRKAYESSRKIPLILQVKLLPQCDIWEDLFQDSCPDFCDIALYFFPSANIERSKENHASLFRLMETENAAMRSYIDGVELLIFTSKQLHVESQDIIARSGMGNFLWGVFRHAKHDKIICNKFPSLATPLGSQHDDHANMDRDEAVGMEIDMVGGTVLGRIDVAVSKESSSRFCVESNKETVDEDALKSNILYSFKDLDSTVEHEISKPEQAHHLVA
ncbi:PHD finger-containing protein 6-like isoform X2 [Populus alba]